MPTLEMLNDLAKAFGLKTLVEKIDDFAKSAKDKEKNLKAMRVLIKELQTIYFEKNEEFKKVVSELLGKKGLHISDTSGANLTRAQARGLLAPRTTAATDTATPEEAAAVDELAGHLMTRMMTLLSQDDPVGARIWARASNALGLPPDPLDIQAQTILHARAKNLALRITRGLLKYEDFDQYFLASLRALDRLSQLVDPAQPESPDLNALIEQSDNRVRAIFDAQRIPSRSFDSISGRVRKLKAGIEPWQVANEVKRVRETFGLVFITDSDKDGQELQLCEAALELNAATADHPAKISLLSQIVGPDAPYRMIARELAESDGRHSRTAEAMEKMSQDKIDHSIRQDELVRSYFTGDLRLLKKEFSLDESLDKMAQMLVANISDELKKAIKDKSPDDYKIHQKNIARIIHRYKAYPDVMFRELVRYFDDDDKQAKKTGRKPAMLGDKVPFKNLQLRKFAEDLTKIFTDSKTGKEKYLAVKQLLNMDGSADAAALSLNGKNIKLDEFIAKSESLNQDSSIRFKVRCWINR
jgi:hypothetical protein